MRFSSGGARPLLAGKYKLGTVLGQGSTAKVYRAHNVLSGEKVAIKCIFKGGNLADPILIKREIAIMRLLRHPHITRLIEVLASRSKVYFVLELAEGGDLLTRMAARTDLFARSPVHPLSEDDARRYFQQLISAVSYCHSRGVYHRDLKPENLLLDAAGNLKVSDFGLSALIPDTDHDQILLTQCGTPAFVAPEILTKKGYSGGAADIWSCGVILFAIIAGHLPFNGYNQIEMYKRICIGEYRCPKSISPELRQLISRLLDTNPLTRITVAGIVLEPWFLKGLDNEQLASMTQHCDCSNFSMAASEGEEGRELNAFDLISFAGGFNLSGLFEPEFERERFVSTESIEEITLRLEEMGREEELAVRRVGKEGGELSLEERRSGNQVAAVELGRLTEGLVVVEVEMCGKRSSKVLRDKVMTVLNRPRVPLDGITLTN